MSLLILRVCNKVEARAQRVGDPYRRPTPDFQVVASTQEGLHGTLLSEYWRRIINRQFKNLGLGFRSDHTLLLEVPAETLVTDRPLPGYEYVVVEADLEQVLVRGVAGPEWPPPAWVPQPRHEFQWDPRSTGHPVEVMKWRAKQ